MAAGIFLCRPATGGGFAWVLHAPVARLTDIADGYFAVHYAEPPWTALDGSAVVGARVV